MNGAPIFILGNPRSGTTLLRLMLTSHPRIVVPPECGFAVWLFPRYQDWRPAQPGELDRFAADVVACRKFETWGLAVEELRRFLALRPPASYAEAVSRVYELYARPRPRAHRWGDKNNFHVDRVATIDELFPRAVLVHIVRDGRDVACSYRQLRALRGSSPYAPDLPGGMEEIAAEWVRNNERVRADLGELAARRRHRVRFEELVTEPERTLRALCAFLGEEWAPRMLDYHRLNRERVLEPTELLAWKQKTLRPPIPTEVGRHRRELSSEEIARFEAVAADTLRRFGYTV